MKNIRRWFLLVFFFEVAGVLAADSPVKADAGHHSLWKIQGKTNSVYLLGSVHALTKANYPLPPVIETAYSNSSTLVFEADVAEMEDPNNAVKVLQKAMLPDGTTLESQLPLSVYQEFTNRANAAGLVSFMYERFKPAMAAMTLEVLESKKLGLDEEYGLDRTFYHRAKQDSKQTIPLETFDFQACLITDLSKEEGEMVMKSTLKELDTLKSEVGDILSAWQNGDSGKLDTLISKGDDFPAITKRLITDRSKSWVPKIEELLKEDKPALVIVGAAHLVGKEGVVELLRQKKWKVTQL